jgi:hypothetical protein
MNRLHLLPLVWCVAAQASTDLQIMRSARDGNLTLTNSFTNGVCMIEKAAAVTGPFVAARQGFSTLSTVAGAGGATGSGVNQWSPSFEGQSATNALLSRPHIAMADRAGNIYIADKDAHGLRQVRPDGTIVTVAGINRAGNGPDTATLGTQVALNEPNGLWVLSNGTVVKRWRFADCGRLRWILKASSSSPNMTPATSVKSVFFGTSRKLWQDST